MANKFTLFQRAAIWAIWSVQDRADLLQTLPPDGRMLVTRRGLENMLGFSWSGSHTEKINELVKTGFVTWFKLPTGIYAYALTRDQIKHMRENRHLITRETFGQTVADSEVPF